jgi:hypothetical protein
MTKFYPSLPQSPLSTSEERFCELIAEGVPPEDAALQSGVYAGQYEKNTLSKVLSKPAIQELIFRLTQDKLRTVGTAIAANQLTKLALSAQSEAVQLGAAKWIAENAGLGVASRIADRDVSTSARSLSEYSLAELEQLVKTGQETLAQLPKLKVLDITPSEPEIP